jgi:hypothetical protein
MPIDDGLAPKWSPRGLWQRFYKTVKRPSDIILVCQVGLFISTVSYRLERTSLPALLTTFHSEPSFMITNVSEGIERLNRLSEPWLRLGIFRTYNTCYLRALLLYRFLDVGNKVKRIHFVVEPGTHPGDRLKGHAWVTINGRIVDPEMAALAGRTREIYSYPPEN